MLVEIEAETPEEAQARVRDGYGKRIGFPKTEVYTEILDAYQYRELKESFNAEPRRRGRGIGATLGSVLIAPFVRVRKRLGPRGHNL